MKKKKYPKLYNEIRNNHYRNRIITLAYFFICLAFILGLVHAIMFAPSNHHKMEIKINNIEYGIEEGLDCYIPNIENEHCPLPHDIEITIEGFVPPTDAARFLYNLNGYLE